MLSSINRGWNGWNTGSAALPSAYQPIANVRSWLIADFTSMRRVDWKRFRKGNWIPMAAFDHSLVTLRFFGDDLLPEEVSSLLGANPTASYHKGQQLKGSQSSAVRIARTGSWRLSAARREPEALEAQIFEILDQLTGDPAVWQSSAPFRPDLFCGLFIGSSNDGVSLSPRALLALGQRGIELGLDIYDADEEERNVPRPEAIS